MPNQNELDISEEKNKKIAKILAVCFALFLFLDFLIVSLLFGLSDWIATLIFAMLLIVPAYLSNAGMVLVGGGKPIDRGKVLKDGKRLFGAHKTWKGLVLGPLYIGIPISIGIYLLFLALWKYIVLIIEAASAAGAYFLYDNIVVYQYYFIGGLFPTGFVVMLIRIIFCAYGAALGDLLGSFLKRRFNIGSGNPFWIVDQLDFVSLSILFTAIPGLFLPKSFLIPDLNIIIFLLILTPAVSIIANTVAYAIGLKDVPW
ncbi:MAG: CDP-archaeol synthase [Candidatus Lokiarchaeota archaeon]|nr:CDP-archaeol synthase [Candidatus Lokiarchaeota archaeon]MBD3201868.1 CDP-archaeol synthase [Candidatus Lokiarchaeota archaeon]